MEERRGNEKRALYKRWKQRTRRPTTAHRQVRASHSIKGLVTTAVHAHRPKIDKNGSIRVRTGDLS